MDEVPLRTSRPVVVKRHDGLIRTVFAKCTHCVGRMIEDTDVSLEAGEGGRVG
jgi:hypothetical protein